MPLDDRHALSGIEASSDLLGILSGARGLSGVIWTLGDSRDLNANLVRFDEGRGVGEHTNDEVDVLFVGVSGSGLVQVDGKDHALSAGRLVLASKGSMRATRALSDQYVYLTIHRRRGPPGVGARTASGTGGR